LLKGTVVDLHIDTIFSTNSSALEVGCPPPGIGAEKSAEMIRIALELWSSYAVGSAALECAVVDLHGALPNINSTALGVACPPPGHRGKFKRILLTTIHPLTASAVLLSKILV
jgi:hypothetical protein